MARGMVYVGDNGEHINDKSNPHEVTTAQLQYDGASLPTFLNKVNTKLFSKTSGSLTLSKTSVTLSVGHREETVKITRPGNGAIGAVSSNPNAVDVELAGEQLRIIGKGNGSATITVSVGEGTTHAAPQNKTIAVTSTTPPALLQNCTPAQIKQVANANKILEYYSIGDLTTLVPLVGPIGDGDFNLNLRYRLVDLTPDGHPIFMQAVNEAGVEIALTTSSYNTYIDADGAGLCMNRKGQIGNTIDDTLSSSAKAYGPNKDGYAPCYANITLMAQYFAALPTAWQNEIVTTPIWADNVGNKNNTAEAIQRMLVKVFLPGMVNLFGYVGNANEHLLEYETQWAYFKAGNSRKAYRSDAPTTAAFYFSKDANRSADYYFCGVTSSTGSTSYYHAAYAAGLRPAFVL